MTAPLPKIPPGQQSQMDQFYASCEQMLDRYLHGFEMDMNRHAVKHGKMPDERAHYDMTRIFVTQMKAGELPMNMALGILAAAIVRGIAKKREGKG
jgi:hypothetical protein